MVAVVVSDVLVVTLSAQRISDQRRRWKVDLDLHDRSRRDLHLGALDHVLCLLCGYGGQDV